MMSRRWMGTALVVCVLLALGVGYSFAAQKKSVAQRVAELEDKVETLEAELRVVKSELARTPRLGMQSAK
jgi:uncharacterized protein with PhoU and TrkA domain